MSRMMRRGALAIGILLMVPQVSQGVPAFARKYGFNCNMCHTGFTKLNDFGQLYRNSGYQIPGQEGLERTVFETAPPLAVRTSVGLFASHRPNANTAGFAIHGLDVFSAGVLHKNISYLIVYTPRIDEPAADYTGPADGSAPSQLGGLESANLVFSNLVPDAVNVRVGRFEPAYHPFSSKRSYYLLQPYEIYAFTTPSNGFVFDDNQLGVEVTGHFRRGLFYALGVVNGSGANPDNSRAKDVYVRASQVFGRGEGQNAGQRIGLFGYFGWCPTITGDPSPDAAGQGNGRAHAQFHRIGADLSLNWQTFNLHGMFLQGSDDQAITLPAVPADTADYDFTGGFVQLDYAGLMNNRLVGSAAYNWVTPPDFDEECTISAFSLLVRYYLGDWTAVNVALHAEYTHREEGKADKIKTDQLGLLVDVGL